MNKCFWLVGVVVLVALVGCVPSLHPLYTDEDLVFDPAIVGEWSEKNFEERWIFTKSNEKEYRLLYIDADGKEGKFVVHLVKVEGRLFLDLFPENPDLKENDFYKGHLLPIHTFIRIEQIEPTLRMAMLNYDWIKKFLQDHPDAIQHEKIDDGLLLTGKPKELQIFLIKHEKTKDAFGDFSDMVRKVSEIKK
ncbi:MAG: hypothetical protein HY606_00085 [Planctomycetes bacterium]|nr:hypothetical protein [Planctomycetota bacterium]